MIGYYVHHHGSGHLRRMMAVTAEVAEPVTVLSSLPPPPGCVLPWLRLARDDVGRDVVDAEAAGTLHWVPRYDDGLRKRAAQIVGWVEQQRPTLVVVDVSVEVTVLVRLTGTPVVVVAMPGARTDQPHLTAYDLAEALLVPWPASHADSTWPESWVRKAWHVGAFGRYDSRSLESRRDPPRGRRPRGLLLWGSGGTSLGQQDLDELRHATPGWDWDSAGVTDVRSEQDVWNALVSADVVVTHAGQNAVAEVAAARVPAVVIADPRPFGEQAATVRAIRDADVAVGLPHWPAPDAWPELLHRASSKGGERWNAWCPGDGARRAARALDGLALQLRSGRRREVQQTLQPGRTGGVTG